MHHLAPQYIPTPLLTTIVSLLISVSFASTAPHLPPPLLGIHPDIRAQWESGLSAACDGRSLPLASVNDGVCDCADGRCARRICCSCHRMPCLHLLRLPLHISSSFISRILGLNTCAVMNQPLAHAQTPAFSAPTLATKARSSLYRGSTVSSTCALSDTGKV